MDADFNQFSSQCLQISYTVRQLVDSRDQIHCNATEDATIISIHYCEVGSVEGLRCWGIYRGACRHVVIRDLLMTLVRRLHSPKGGNWNTLNFTPAV
jgi:hypothetical protein